MFGDILKKIVPKVLVMPKAGLRKVYEKLGVRVYAALDEVVSAELVLLAGGRRRDSSNTQTTLCY